MSKRPKRVVLGEGELDLYAGTGERPWKLSLWERAFDKGPKRLRGKQIQFKRIRLVAEILEDK